MNIFWSDEVIDYCLSAGLIKPHKASAAKKHLIQDVKDKLSCDTLTQCLTEESQVEEQRQRIIDIECNSLKRKCTEYKWRKAGIRVTSCFNEPEKIDNVKLDFSSREWADLADANGKLLTACCANISAIRNIIIGAKREGGFIKVEDLLEVVNMQAGHGFEDSPNHPITRMVTLWNTIKDDVKKMYEPLSCDINDPKDAISSLYNVSATLSWDEIFSHEGESDDSRISRHALRESSLFTLAGAVNTLYSKMKDLSFGTVSGFAVVNAKKEVVRLSNGLAVFAAESSAQEMANEWTKHSKATFSVAPVKVSMEKGIEFV